jgi:hypothetical protein
MSRDSRTHNSNHYWWIALALLPWTAEAATVPFKQPMHPSVQAKQPAVYACVSDYGIGVQYMHGLSNWSGPVGALAGQMAGGLFGGLGGQAIGDGVHAIRTSGPTELAKADADMLRPLFDRETAQRNFEQALAAELTSLTLFSAPLTIKQHASSIPMNPAELDEDPVLVVDLYASLTMDYRALQVTAVAYELSRELMQADPKSKNAGRVYRNRFDYVSALLPAPPVKSAEEIKADVEAVNAKYRGRKLEPLEKAEMNRELREAKLGTTLEEYRAPLLEQWTANGAARLHEALNEGTQGVARLLAADFLDFKPADVWDKVDVYGWKNIRDVGSGRVTNVFVGGPFTGVLMSEPSGMGISYCQGTAFGVVATQDPLPKLCAGEQSR